MSVNYRREGEFIVVSGQTYPHKESIKSLGCRFVGDRKVWQVSYSEETMEKISELCKGLGGGRLETLKNETKDIPDAVARRADPTPPRSLKLSVPATGLPPTPLNIDGGPKGIPNSEGLTVRELMDRVSFAISNAFPTPVWVVGEIQNFQNRSSAIYLSLAEGVEGGNQAATATASATIWSNAMRMMEHRHGRDQLNEILADGMKVRCLCQVSVYKNRGNVSLSIQDIDISFTKGALALAREKLLKELKLKGMDQKNKSLPLPAFPFRVGLVCAEGSRAETDLKHQLQVNGFCGEILFISAAAQGERVVKEVPAAIKTLEYKSCDVIIVTRGGGSAADLRWFDAAEVAYAICNSTVPVIAAIGHHDDESVAELVAFQRCKTPTAAADFVTERFAQTKKRIEDMANSLAEGLTRQVDFYTEKQALLGERLASAAQQGVSRNFEVILGLMPKLERGFQSKIQIQRELFSRLGANLNMAAIKNIMSQEQKLAQFDKLITAADPTPWLKQGWTQLIGKSGQIKSTDDIKNGESVKARILDGVLEMTVNKIEKSNSNTENI